MKRTALFLVLLVAIAGCAEDKPGDPTLKLYAFDCGRLLMSDVQAFGLTNEETEVRELIVPCYMIEHPLGRLLWDGGLPSVIANTDGWQASGPTFSQRLDRTLAEQLADMELGMDAFDFVAFSHLHFDHVGVANELEGATWLIQKAENEAAFAEDVTVFGFDRSSYDRLAEGERMVLEGEHDVFGDGRVRIVPAPGHTPGHQVLLIDLAETGPVLLAGDLYHFRFNRDNRRVPRFNFAAPQTLESMTKVENLIAETGAQLWIEHDLAWFDQLKHAPEFYQ